ncbi:MAG: imelysin family protein [Salibacteraceae bacterium]
MFIALLLQGLNSCVEKGCTDPEALNYRQSAERDDESCRYGDKYEEEKREVLINHANLAHAFYKDALAQALSLQIVIGQFLDKPTDDGFSLVKLTWQSSYYSYAQCAPLRFSDGPIDDSPNLHQILGTWPIKPADVDYTRNGESGVVYDSDLIPEINASTLTALNDADRIVCGFHAMEYLLWGEDYLPPGDLTVGFRAFTDYELGDSTRVDVERRRQYLSVLAELIVANLTTLTNEWDENGVDKYRSRFLRLPVNTAMKQVITGIATLCRSEMAERAMTFPKFNGIDAYEISAYSDNTAIDLIAMHAGIEILMNGLYTPLNGMEVSGRSLINLADIYNSDLATSITDQLEANKEALEIIPKPFDYQLAQEAEFGEGPIAAAAKELEVLEDLLFELAREMDFGLNTDLPDN